MAVAISREQIEKIEHQVPSDGVEKIAQYLQGILGQRLTAYICGLNDPKMIGLWIQGKGKPKGMMTLPRLKEAYKATLWIVTAYDKETAKSWFFGTNTRLGDQSPAYLLRNANSIDDIQLVAPVAKAFALSAE